MIVYDLLKAAYANLGAVDLEGDLTSAQVAQGLISLNSMIGTVSQKQTLYGLFNESFAITSGQATYTVVSGGDFNTAWAYAIESAYVRDAQGVDYPLQIITEGQYDNVGLKTVSARPQFLLYNPKGYPTGLVTLYYVPDKAYTLFWSAQKPLTSFASSDDTVGIGPQFEEYLEYNLSIRLAPKCGATVSAEVAAIAKRSEMALPIVTDPAQFDGAFSKGRRYNVYSDQI
jgi:hypothetical protein